MAPSSYQALAVFLLAIVPGFVATSAWERAKTWKGQSADLLTVLRSLALSVVVQIIVAPLTIGWLLPVRSKLDHYPWRVAVWAVLTTLVVPVAAGTLWARLEDTLTVPKRSRFALEIQKVALRLLVPTAPPTIWDWIFTRNVPNECFLVVEFTDGKHVAGVFADGASAITSPQRQGVFLVKEWSVDPDGYPLAEIRGTGGVIIDAASGVRSVRIIQGQPRPGGDE